MEGIRTIKDKPRLIIYALELLMTVFATVYLILALAGITMPNVPKGSMIASGIVTFFLGIGFIIFERLIRQKLPLMLHIIYTVYFYLSNVIGSCLGVFRYSIDPFTWRGEMISDFGWFDKVMHSILGYVLCIFAIYLAIKTSTWNKSILGDVLIIFAVSMALAALWEIYEFSTDSVLSGQDMQRGPWLLDTMVDMTLHLIFTLVFIMQYLISRYTRFSLGITFMAKNLATGERIKRKNHDKKSTQNIKAEQPNVEELSEKPQDELVDNDIINQYETRENID